ncbi:MAG: DUF1015 family protein [Candidatus Neomarinimicrobiota bacterium]
MAEIHPFPAVLFRPEEGTDVTPFVAPPYDVITPAERIALPKRSPYNVIRLTLPEAPPDGDRYQAAAKLFQSWIQSGILYTVTTPALYVWEQEFRHVDTTYRRRALVAKVTCEPYRPGCVMRHEYTYPAPKEDRLRLFRATGAQFSQIFGIFEDDQGEVSSLLAEMVGQTPWQTARGDDGHISRLFNITDEKVIKRFQAGLHDRTVIIADGHHRYETSVAYYQQLGRKGTTLMTLVPSSDPGLIVLPTHRTLGLSLSAQAFCQALGDEFSIEAHPLESWPRLHRQTASHSAGGIILAAATPIDQSFWIKWKNKSGARSRSVNQTRGQSDVVVFHENILPRLTATGSADPGTFGYFHEAEEAVAAARAQGHWAFLLRPTSVRVLLNVAKYEEVLPAKSTYFYPKFLAGFINARLD